MAKTTFSGPVRSRRGFITAGPDAVINITAETTLTFDDHAGRLIEINDADGAVTLPTIQADSKGASAGQAAPNVNNQLGAVYRFYIGTAATDLDIKTDGTDKFVGGAYTGIDDSAAGKTFISGASNDVFTQNGTTKGGLAGSIVVVTAIASAKYHVAAQLLGSGTLVTPFADA